MILKLILSSLILCQFRKFAISDCVWYGECNHDERNRVQNCPRSDPPQLLQDPEAIQILRDLCPQYVNADGSAKTTCCAADQLRTLNMKTSVIKGFVGRCPSCFQSFYSMICDMMCHPEQSTFMEVVTTKYNNVRNLTYIDHLRIYVDEEYMNGTFNACKQIILPSTGQLVMALMCGTWGAEKCNPKRWFEFMGRAEGNEHVPFQIDYVTSIGENSSATRLLNPPYYKCNAVAEYASTACSCVDCEESCPISLREDDDKTKNDIQSQYYVFAIIFSVIITIVFSLKLISNCNSGPTERKDCNKADQQKVEGRTRTAQSSLENLLTNFFVGLGESCASHPWKIIFLSVCIVAGLSYGARRITLITDPVELWSFEDSPYRLERKYFNENFGPFYRPVQVIVTAKNMEKVKRNTSQGTAEYGAAFHKDFLLQFKSLQDNIMSLKDGDVDLATVCFSPLMQEGKTPSSPKHCFVQSVWGYFRGNLNVFNNVFTKSDGSVVDYLTRLKDCIQNIYAMNCLAQYGGPVDPSIALGGFPQPNSTLPRKSAYMQATSLVLTIVLNNHLDKSKLNDTLKWEKKFLDFMRNFTQQEHSTMDISFYADRFIEDEIDRESHTNISIVVISYVTMFLYVALVLGEFRGCSTFLLESRIMLGCTGVTIVLSSVMSSIGFHSYLGIQNTMVALEVMPFLVLAVGVDNIFMLIHSFEKIPMNEREKLEKYVGRVLSKVGPSILLAGFCESSCFFLASLSPMPCVKYFATYSALALIFNFILQLTCYISLISLDLKRRIQGRPDVFCCMLTKSKVKEPRQNLAKFFRNYYTPFVMSTFVRPLLMIGFVAWFLGSIFVLPGIKVGLEQDVAFPKDSPLKKYMQDLKKYVEVGPPVYFVVTEGLDLRKTSVQNLLCSGLHCNSDSLTSQIYRASKNPERTYIRKPSQSWIDDYFDYLSTAGCCLVTEEGDVCTRDPNTCLKCNITLDKESDRPIVSDLEKYLNNFLTRNPDSGCIKAGHAAYGKAVRYRSSNGSTQIGPYHFMAYHSLLKSSDDFYSALKEARLLANNITRMIQSQTNTTARVFPYSVFYIFYEQYLDIRANALQNVAMSLGTVFVVTFGLTYGNLKASLIILVNVTMMIVDFAALLYFLDIQLNAISLLNIVMTVGIAVEFSYHIVYYFTTSKETTPLLKAKDSLNQIGSAVFSGITLTKFIGIVVLSFSKSEVFQVYFFQMYLGVVIIGALHGLVFLPILLSYFGTSRKYIRENQNREHVRYQIIKTNGESIFTNGLSPDT